MKSKKYQIYGDLLHKHRPTIRSMIIEIIYAKFVELKRGKITVYRENAVLPPFEEQNQNTPGVAKYIAVVSDADEVVEILKMNENAANTLLLNNNRFISFSPDNQIVKIGAKVVNNEFVDGVKNEED